MALVLRSAVAMAGQETAAPVSPQQVAEGHLRRAREHAKASCEMLRQHRRHAVDGYFLSCQEVWNAVWTCPESPDVLGPAAEVYADSLAGPLEAARCHGRLTPDGLWIGTATKPVLVQCGLHAKLQVVESGTVLWDAIADLPFAEIRLRPEVRRLVAPGYFFHPLPCVKRVVFIATPHRGSVLAALGVGRLASLTVRQPPAMEAIHDEAVRLNPGAFHPDYEQRLPTSVDLLRPNSSILQAVERLRPACWVTSHAVVGVAHHSVVGGDDCVVPAASTHTPGAVSEITVPARLTRVHHHPQTIAEVQRILTQHLHECGAAVGSVSGAAAFS